ncbi:MAG: valine--tRNA ligase [Armatimonadetes bacterium]|nr:valine--tRNA ligase [Armatimonadota bacterium]
MTTEKLKKPRSGGYNPALVEDKWYSFWLDRGYFEAKPDGAGKPYCITIPPPNITGSLHIGHALNNTILDAMTRWHRMMGENAVCIPGIDHASIATQNVVERELTKEGLTRHDLGREKFVERCWRWREEYGNRILEQFRKLGCSYDWSRTRFTMDERYLKAIGAEFKTWWDSGLIYRGVRVVNWCPRCATGISDIEVEREARSGNLYTIRYDLEDGSGAVTVATTRPETMLGDTAVAVHPQDERYRALIGRNAILPLVGRTIPIIADEFVDPEFGTGAVKVTPAHDLNDFECGLRHNLPQVVVIGEDARMTAEAGKRYEGMDRFEARKQVVDDLKQEGFLIAISDYDISYALCERCHTILEPLLSEQWFVRMREIAQPAIQAVRDGRIQFYPERYGRLLVEWLENIKDWCISRQLWWGQRIPIWRSSDGRTTVAFSDEESKQKLGRRVVFRDEDVLDTWFSSAIWPQAVLGWPEDTLELKTWYPTDLLSTAQEILYLWVARMIMTGLFFCNEIPFHHVYIHATVLDEQGRRMSKSLGNGVDPLEMVEKYGADALRFSLMQQSGKNQDIRFSEERVKLAAGFCNKIWNASRFVISHLTTDGMGYIRSIGPMLTVPDRWILSRLNKMLEEVNAKLSTYDMDAAARAIYQFIWDEYCDWYLEMAKPRLSNPGADADAARSILYEVLETTLRALHPMMPFLTEEIWQSLPGHGETIMLADYPKPDPERFDAEAESAMDYMMQVTQLVRNLRAEHRIPAAARPNFTVSFISSAAQDQLRPLLGWVKYLARLGEELPAGSATAPGRYLRSPISGGEITLNIGAEIDTKGATDATVIDESLVLVDEAERKRLLAALAKVESDLERSSNKLKNEKFLEKAPAEVVEKERRIVEELTEKRDRLASRFSRFTDPTPR